MESFEALQKIGLNEHEARVYVAALELGQDTVTNIAKKAGLKRPTVYLVLDSLIARGLINTSTKGKRTIYGAEEPEKLHSIVAEKQRAVKTILPYLSAIHNRGTEKPRIRFYEGMEGLWRVYEEAFVNDEIRLWGSIAKIESVNPDFVDWFIETTQKLQNRVSDLLTDTPQDHSYAKHVTRAGYEVRFLPNEAQVMLDSIQFGNKLAFVAFDPEPHGLIIESESILNSFHTLWSVAWEAAIPYKK